MAGLRAFGDRVDQQLASQPLLELLRERLDARVEVGPAPEVVFHAVNHVAYLHRLHARGTRGRCRRPAV